jgi:asparagine synthase (glutamine-hydrolysing)
LSEVSRQPDEIFMARYLVHLPGEFERTAWQDVSRLLPGHCLALTEAGPRVKRYCCLEDAPRVRLRSRRDYEEGFLSLFRQAVRVRLRGVGAVGTMMSGGLDSGSVTALAAEVMRGRGERLTAFTSVPAYPAQHLVRHGTSDEWVRAHTVARHWDNIDHVAVKAEKESPLAAVEKLLAVYPQPVHAASNQYWMQAILREARQRGIGVLLNGQMGNGGVSWNGGRNGIFHLFAQGHWTAGRRALAGWRSGRKNKTAWYAWRSQVLSPLVGPWVHRLRGASLSRRGMGDNRTLFTVDFERRAGLAGLWERETRESGCFWPEDPLAERLRIFENNTIVAGAIAEAQSAATGVDVRDPTADLRLVEYCLGVPDDCYLDERGSRVLIRGAMAGLVPDEVRWNTAYGTQAADFLPRLRAHGAELEIILDRFAATPAVSGRLNVEVLRAAWNGLPRGDNPDSARDVRAFILRGVMAGMFLETSALTDS